MNNNPMKEAANEASIGIDKKSGGPFGSVVVKDGEIIGRGHNRVVEKKDPTAHGEVEAIRDACENIGGFDLAGCELYTTCYPCPMCLGAILWARIDKVYYCLTSEDVEEIGFDDKDFYERLSSKDAMEKLLALDLTERETCLQILKDYVQSEPTMY